MKVKVWLTDSWSLWVEDEEPWDDEDDLIEVPDAIVNQLRMVQETLKLTEKIIDEHYFQQKGYRHLE